MRDTLLVIRSRSRWLLHSTRLFPECPPYVWVKSATSNLCCRALPTNSFTRANVAHSSRRSCSHFKRSLIPCYMYDSWWVCSKAFRFIIKWMKQYLCESKLIQMCAGVSFRLCLSPTWNLVGSGGNLLVLQKWKQAVCILQALIYDSRFRLAVLQQYLATFKVARPGLSVKYYRSKWKKAAAGTWVLGQQFDGDGTGCLVLCTCLQKDFCGSSVMFNMNLTIPDSMRW